jgi:hypothetical protein
MAQIYQYNTSMVPFPLAHLLVALAVVVSARARVIDVAIGSLLFFAAFSIYQAVVANAATIFVVWLLGAALFGSGDTAFWSRRTARTVAAVLASVIAGGVVYLAAVSMMRLEPDTIHSSEEAFRLGGALNWNLSIPEIIQGTRSFFVWPEHYFASYLKGIQIALLVAVAIFCLWLPKSPATKIAALLLLGLACFTPRVLQLVHPKGQFHSLTLTAYGVLVAGTVMIVNRAGSVATRNLSIVASVVLILGYVIQCNWISTVNYLNTAAHFATMTQVLSRVRSVPDTHWDGKTIAVVGRYDMPGGYPFRGATGVASKFIDANHMNELARLARDEARFVAADATMPRVLEFAATHAPWPAPGSVGVVDGMGVVVFSRSRAPGP